MFLWCKHHFSRGIFDDESSFTARNISIHCVIYLHLPRGIISILERIPVSRAECLHLLRGIVSIYRAESLHLLCGMISIYRAEYYSAQ